MLWIRADPSNNQKLSEVEVFENEIQKSTFFFFHIAPLHLLFSPHSEALPEIFLNCIIWTPKHPRICGICDGWWHSGGLLWQQQKQSRAQTELGEKIDGRLSSTLGVVLSGVCALPAHLQSQHLHFKTTTEPNWRYAIVNVLLWCTVNC